MLSTGKTRGRLIAIAGGIGSGKSVVSRILVAMGYEVYDCDSRARELMDVSNDIKAAIAERISAEAITECGSIDRRRLASIVFNDAEKLAVLNEIVHSMVREDLWAWAEGREIAFVETAILYESGLDKMVDEVWLVDAPKEIRIERVIKRNSLSAAEVEARIQSQSAFIPEHLHPNTNLIVNDNFLAILPQIELLLQ